MSRRLVHLTMTCALVVGVGVAAAADLQDRTRRAYEEYAERATRLFVERSRDGASGSASGEPSRSATIVVRPAREDGILSVPSGLVHHWTGSTFISGVTMEDALDVSYAYDGYDSVYTPVVSSKLLGRDGNTYRVQLRIKGSGGGLSAILDVTSRVQYFYPDDRRVYSMPRSHTILFLGRLTDPTSSKRDTLLWSNARRRTT